ncbi:MAG: Spx/MgsR family RNA polymerase-binding regulatory protein [Ferruginibacter sp.]|nr:Spx/MgsR family RNA polymerase-binding regulatory protein [Ferruginibacter sp.]NOU38853.1 Spx/MgsR family RNA polymerase-binding regulatory protein [Ferruginibacter sp.]
MIKIYGIPNCGSVKKAFAWLTENKIKFEFYDFKKESITEAKINEWLASIPLETLLNKSSTAWKGLTKVAQKKATTKTEAIKLILTNPNLVKRPVLEIASKVLVGFNEEVYKKELL